MDKFDRFQQLHRALRAHRRPVPVARLAERMECTERTVKRLIHYMRDFLHAPIEYCPAANGWHYTGEGSEYFELPGLWLTSGELRSLILLLHVLESFGNGLLNEELKAIKGQVGRLLTARGISPSAFTGHIRVLPLGNRHLPGKIFQSVGEALLRRRQLRIRYTSYQQKTSYRTLSPQTLIHYRENWYLDAWCHLREGLRTFSLARMDRVEILDQPATEITPEELQAHFAESYGIFAGRAKHRARLRFLPEVAHEIAQQQWHPEQRGEWQGGNYLLSFPYGDERELVGDILRYIPHVVVEGPSSLKQAVVERLREGLMLYEAPLQEKVLYE